MCPELETADLSALAELCLSSHTHCQETPVLALSTALLALGSAVTREPGLWSCQMGQGPESAPLHDCCAQYRAPPAVVRPERGSENSQS